jgi:predicted metal-dependent hydrolase
VTEKHVDANELSHGIALFNQGKFFDAHEVLEDVWRAAPASQKKFFQGLVQVAVAFHHHSTGNLVGMKSVMARAAGNLSEGKDSFAGIRAQPLLASLAAWEKAMNGNTEPPALPKIELAG